MKFIGAASTTKLTMHVVGGRGKKPVGKGGALCHE